MKKKFFCFRFRISRIDALVKSVIANEVKQSCTYKPLTAIDCFVTLFLAMTTFLTFYEIVRIVLLKTYRRLSVGFASMTYSVNGYGLLAIGNFIEDSIVADSDSVFGLTACEFNA
jgi:hypothetical protein